MVWSRIQVRHRDLTLAIEHELGRPDAAVDPPLSACRLQGPRRLDHPIQGDDDRKRTASADDGVQVSGLDITHVQECGRVGRSFQGERVFQPGRECLGILDETRFFGDAGGFAGSAS